MDQNHKGVIMFDFVRKAFRKLFDLSLLLTPIIFAIIGVVLANMTKTTSRGETSYGFHPVLGFLLGLIAGILADIFGGGLIATFLNIDENLEKLDNIDDNIQNISDNIYEMNFDYVVNESTNLYSNPDLASNVVLTLYEDIGLTLLEIGKMFKMNDIEGNWYKVETINKERGWCFSGYLRKGRPKTKI